MDFQERLVRPYGKIYLRFNLECQITHRTDLSLVPGERKHRNHTKRQPFPDPFEQNLFTQGVRFGYPGRGACGDAQG